MNPETARIAILSQCGLQGLPVHEIIVRNRSFEDPFLSDAPHFEYLPRKGCAYCRVNCLFQRFLDLFFKLCDDVAEALVGPPEPGLPEDLRIQLGADGDGEGVRTMAFEMLTA